MNLPDQDPPDDPAPADPPPGGASASAGNQSGADPEGADASAGDTSGREQARPDRRPIAVAGGPSRPPPRRTGVFVDAEDLRTHVGGLLRVMLGGYQVDPFGNFSFTHDGARVFVTVGPTPVGLAVSVHSVTNIDLDLTADLARFLAATNHRLGFGTLSYDEDNRAVWLRHTLLGTALDAPELQAAVAMVARTAASLDDVIVQRFGGRTFDEAPEDVRDATSPPTAPGPDEAGGEPENGNVSGYL